MHRKTIDVWVGLFVLLGAVSLLFLALKAGNMSTISFTKTYAIVGKFDNIGGLKPQAPVKSAGVVVGRVGDITFDDKTFQALVRLDMNPATSSRKTAR
jgi:phospholipid/cholesterol/gamma-HCH transport system substrate-binding protein